METGKIKTLFSDMERTEALFPRTKTSAVSNDDGRGLDALLENLPYFSSVDSSEAATVPMDADTLGGLPAENYATQSFVTNKIAEAQLGGGSGGDIDVSGYATKDDVNAVSALVGDTKVSTQISTAINSIDYPVDSVNGKTGAVQLTANDVGALSSNSLSSAVNTALAQAKASGEFDGAKGDKGDNGATGVGISSVKQTTTSSADSGSNVVTVTLTNGATSTFTVKNGSKGSTGATGSQGPTGPQGPRGPGITKTLLWTNASPSSAFSGQTLYFSLSSYTCVEIVFLCNSSQTTSRVCTSIIPVGYAHEEQHIHQVDTVTPVVSARIITVNTSSIVIGGGIAAYTNGAGGNIANNTLNVPLRIYGIKEVS